jgi:Flp pilus assembly protein CpaB
MLAIAVATLGASLFHEAQTPTTTWVPVAKVTIPAGAALLPQDLELRRTIVPTWLAGSITRNPTDLIGTTATTTISPNEIVETSMITRSALKPPLPLVTIALSTSTIGDQLIQPGDRVDVVATYTTPGGLASSQVLAADLRVTALSTTNATYLVTVEVTHVETALAIYQAEQTGKLAIIGATGVAGHAALRVYPPVGGPHVP